MPPRPKKIEGTTEIARRIRELRESLGPKETQTAFARRLGLPHPSNVSKWEAGRNIPEPQMFVRLAGLATGAAKAFFQKQAGLSEGGEIDREILRFVIVTLEAMLEEREDEWPTVEGYATLVADSYDACRRSGIKDFSILKKEILKIA